MSNKIIHPQTKPKVSNILWVHKKHGHITTSQLVHTLKKTYIFLAKKKILKTKQANGQMIDTKRDTREIKGVPLYVLSFLHTPPNFTGTETPVSV